MFTFNILFILSEIISNNAQKKQFRNLDVVATVDQRDIFFKKKTLVFLETVLPNNTMKNEERDKVNRDDYT